MPTSLPAGKDCQGKICDHFQEVHLLLHRKKKETLIKLLLDVSSSKETLLEDYLLLQDRFNMHCCSDYCKFVLSQLRLEKELNNMYNNNYRICKRLTDKFAKTLGNYRVRC